MGARSVQSFFLRLGLPAVGFERHPDAFFAAWDQTLSSGVGQGARYMGPIPSNGNPVQQNLTGAWSAVPAATSQFPAFAQFLSDPLESIHVPAGPWELSFAVRLVTFVVALMSGVILLQTVIENFPLIRIV